MDASSEMPCSLRKIGYVDKKMHIFYTNADCLLNKMSELRVVMSQNQYQVICVTESNLNDDILEAEIQIPNFSKVFVANRKSGEKGGSIIYVHDSVIAEELNIFDSCE